MRRFFWSGLLVLLAWPLWAGEPPSSGEGPQPVEPFTPGSAGPDLSPHNFGTQDGIDYWIGGPAFTPRSSSVLPSHDGSTGAVYFASGTSPMVDAMVNLPNGALVSGMRAFYYDNDSAGDIRVWFTRYFATTSPSFSDIAMLSSTGTPGWTDTWVDINHTIALRGPGGEDAFYAIPVRFSGTASPNLKLRGVRIFWNRQVSPAPATATFADVPTSHPFFQHVEALAASGITGGCGAGNFCPGSYVTRGQMAVFLSKALGLHWPPF